jgi:hypothetical protein
MENQMRPQEYAQAFTVMQDTFYQLLELDKTPSALKTGMLKVGRVVWLPKPEEMLELGQAKVRAYAEGLGTVSVSRNTLASVT